MTTDFPTCACPESDGVSIPVVSPTEPAEVCAGGLTPQQAAEAGRRRELLVLALPLFQAGASMTTVAKGLGVAPSTLSRLLGGLMRGARRLNPAEVIVELLDKPVTALAPAFSQCGRSSEWEGLCRLPAVRARLHALYLLTCGASSEVAGQGRRTGSVALTLARFADDAELCPPLLAVQLRRGSQPAPLVRVIREITAEVEALHRGAKHAQHAGPVGRRTDVVVMEDGTEVTLSPGDVWVLDDMSENHPYWAPTAEEPGWMISRQGLYCRDMCGRWLGVDLVARPRESYRAEDILRFLRRLMRDLGKPRLALVMERGVWESKAVRGDSKHGGLAQADVDRVQEGLRAIGVRLVYTWKSQGKVEIEGGFNYLQRVLATMVPDALSVGRHAGEFERAARQLRRARGEVQHPSVLGFIAMDVLADRIEQAFRWINGAEPAARSAREQSYDAAWEAAVAARPLQGLTPADLAVFLPDVRELMIRGGKVTVTCGGEEHDFLHAEEFAALGHGYRVMVRWDPCEPTLGAAIYNGESSSANFRGYVPGQFICFADYLAPGPRLNFSGVSTPGLGLIQRQQGVHRTSYRGLPRVNAPSAKESAARDGLGGVTTVRRHTGTAPVLAEVRGVRPTEAPAATGPVEVERFDDADVARRVVTTVFERVEGIQPRAGRQLQQEEIERL